MIIMTIRSIRVPLVHGIVSPFTSNLTPITLAACSLQLEAFLFPVSCFLIHPIITIPSIRVPSVHGIVSPFSKGVQWNNSLQ
jgi:hypothetical protein